MVPERWSDMKTLMRTSNAPEEEDADCKQRKKKKSAKGFLYSKCWDSRNEVLQLQLVSTVQVWT